MSLSVIGLLSAGFYIAYGNLNGKGSIVVLYCTVGLLTGFGFGLLYLPAMDIVEIYFRNNLGLATGIAAAGSGLGQFTMAPLIHLSQEKLGLSLTFYTLAGAVSITFIFAEIYRIPKNNFFM